LKSYFAFHIVNCLNETGHSLRATPEFRCPVLDRIGQICGEGKIKVQDFENVECRISQNVICRMSFVTMSNVFLGYAHKKTALSDGVD